jgi:lipopolysaccharide transport system permease protein
MRESGFTASAGTSHSAAIADIIASLQARHLWGMMGWFDIRQRYRRSILGPFWTSISLCVFVSATSLVYGRLLSVAWSDFVLFIAVGLTAWVFITNMANESCLAFIVYERLIKEVRIPLTAHILRIMWRNLIVFLHNIVIYPILLIYLQTWPGWDMLVLALLGVFALILNVTWLGLFLAIGSARFRDLPPIVANLLQVSFFVTPVLWKPDMLAGITKQIVADYNPLSAFIEVIRAPLLGHAPGSTSVLVVAACTIFGWVVTLMLFARFRARVVYWL